MRIGLIIGLIYGLIIIVYALLGASLIRGNSALAVGGGGVVLAIIVIIAFPIMYGIHRSYALYFGRLAETLRPDVLVRAARAGA